MLMRDAHSTYKKLAVQWQNESFPLWRDRWCFVSSFPAEAGQVVVAESLVLRNRQLLVAAKRYLQAKNDKQYEKEK